MNPQKVSAALVRDCYPKKQELSKKGDFGKVMIIGGSKFYTGAPALAAIAAMRTGSDLVRVYAPERASNIIASFSPAIMSEPLKGEHLTPQHTTYLLEWSEKFDSVVIGNGLCKHPDTFQFVREFISSVKKPCVIDADAIRALTNTPSLKPTFLLTPHSGEFSALSGSDPGDSLTKRTAETVKLSKRLKATVLLKGHVDIISNGYKACHNTTGNPWMTKGGTGDVLAGMCGAFLAMGLNPADAACSASYLNGLSGDVALKRVGPGMISTDVLDSIPQALRLILKK